MTSIIITYHNEPLSVLNECLEQIKSTIDISDYEIIVVDDCSDKPLLIEGVTVLRNSTNLGVGRSFDAGVKIAKGENLIIMACDIRFVANKWASQLVNEIETYPKSITCTCCVGLNARTQCCDTEFFDNLCQNAGCENFKKPAKANMNMEIRRTKSRNYGATMLVFHDHESNPRKPIGFRSIIEAKWQAPLLDRSQSYDIPCVLGAIYGIKKDWYMYIDGFFAHRQWGTLEPYISLKSWLFGGTCRIAPFVETGHIFKHTGTHRVKDRNLLFNKFLVATLLIEQPQRYIDFIPGSNTKLTALKMVDDLGLEDKIKEYRDKTILSFEDYCNKFKIDLRWQK